MDLLPHHAMRQACAHPRQGLWWKGRKKAEKRMQPVLAMPLLSAHLWRRFGFLLPICVIMHDGPMNMHGPGHSGPGHMFTHSSAKASL